MPVLYTSFMALLTRNRILNTIKSNSIAPVITRISLLSGVVEVDLPRWTLHTLDREEPGYWKLNNRPSTVKGGSWTLQNWQKVVTGKSTYRIQHADELRQPQAEIQMADLVTFLLDRGAAPSPHGLRLLRTMGMQTPPNTPLLIYGSGKPVLSVSTPDESDGRLSLKLHWNDDFGSGRSVDSLPPYWIRIASQKLSSERTYPPVRLLLGPSGLQDVRVETPDSRKSTAGMKEGMVDHVKLDEYASPDEPLDDNMVLWFAAATVAVCTEDQGGLTRFAIPQKIHSATRRDAMPLGVLVLLGMRKEGDTPLYAERARIRQQMEQQKRHQELQAQTARQRELAVLSPADRAKAQGVDGLKRLQQMQTDRMQREAEELERKSEALTSQRVGNHIVAEAALAWLQEHGHLAKDPDEASLHTVATWAVSAMLFDASFASAVVSVLDAWVQWVDLVMNDEHYEMIKANQIHFCYAAILINQIAVYETHGRTQPVARDLDDCQRVWGRVCLG